MQLSISQFGKNGPAIIILHGLLGSRQNWHTIARKLGENHRVLVPSLRNHGDSPHGPHSIEHLRQDIVELFSSEQLRDVFLIGHSMGGLAAMSFATKQPEFLKGLVIVDVAPRTRMQRLTLIFDALESVELDKVIRKEDADKQLKQTIQDREIRQFLLQNLKRNNDNRYSWRCNLPELSRFVHSEEPSVINDQAIFSGPVLFIGGGKSEHQIWTYEPLIKSHFPAYKMEIVPNAGHWVHFEAPDEFLKLVTNFVNENS